MSNSEVSTRRIVSKWRKASMLRTETKYRTTTNWRVNTQITIIASSNLLDRFSIHTWGTPYSFIKKLHLLRNCLQVIAPSPEPRRLKSGVNRKKMYGYILPRNVCEWRQKSCYHVGKAFLWEDSKFTRNYDFNIMIIWFMCLGIRNIASTR